MCTPHPTYGTPLYGPPPAPPSGSAPYPHPAVAPAPPAYAHMAAPPPASYVPNGQPQPAPYPQEHDYNRQYAMDYYYRDPSSVPAAPPASVPENALTAGWFDISNGSYLKGLLLGAGITVLVTNSTVQDAVMKGVVKLWTMAQGGVEEVKERFKDVKAEMSLKE